MCIKFRQFHTNDEIMGLADGRNNSITGLKDLAWAYVKPETHDDFQDNRKALIDRLTPPGKAYIEGVWREKETRVVRYYTQLNFNLGCDSSQRVVFYHVVLKAIING